MCEGRSSRRFAATRGSGHTHTIEETLQTVARLLGRTHLRAGLSLQEAASSRSSQELSVLYDYFAARDDDVRCALDRAAFVGRVVHALVESLRGEGELPVRIEDDDIGVAAGGNRAFLREHAEDLRG